MEGVKVDKEFLLKIAENAKLELSEAEIKEFLPQMQELLENFSKLAKIDTEGIEPSMQPVELKNVLREDEIQASLSQEDALKNTEHKKR